MTGNASYKRAVFLLAILVATGQAFTGPLPSRIVVSRHASRIVRSAKDGGEKTPEEHDAATEKAMKAMTAFTNKYLANTGTKLCLDKSVPAVVIKGLAEHKVALGSPLCPCRFYDDKEKEAKDGYWNCPCVPMRERHECHCMLFLTDDNDFAGEETEISFEDVKKFSSGMEP